MKKIMFHVPSNIIAEKLMKFDDGNNVADYARSWVAFHIEKEIINGYPSESGRKPAFKPDTPIKRGEVISILNKIRDIC